MTNVAEIKQAILELNETDYVELRRWFSDLDWEKWDFEEDVKAGRLDFFKEEVLEAKKNGTLGYL